MDSAWHYREAEKLLEEGSALVEMAALIHAVLAVAAALDPQVTDAGIARRITGEMTQS